MSRAGFVLVGGRSSRMGRDKALLPLGPATLVEVIAARVQAAAGTVSLVGSPERYRALPYPIVADRYPGSGPVAGIEAALAASAADWNLIVACDMPSVTTQFLTDLLDQAEMSGADCLAPVSPAGRVEPLCAVYHRACRPALTAALAAGVRKLTEALARLRTAYFPVSEAVWFENLNTPQDWARWTESASCGRHRSQ